MKKEEKTLLEIERTNFSQEVDKFDFGNNIAIYVGGFSVIFILLNVLVELYSPNNNFKVIIYLLFFFLWSAYFYFRNRKIKFEFNQKLLMKDRRYEELGVDIKELNKERKKITKCDFEIFYRR